jgi:hypothetical protein
MQTINKTIDGKSVSFWLEGNTVGASIGELIIGDIATATQVPGFVERHWSRGRDWQLFAASVLDYLPQTHPADSIMASDMKARLFDIVISVGEQLRKEAA